MIGCRYVRIWLGSPVDRFDCLFPVAWNLRLNLAAWIRLIIKLQAKIERLAMTLSSCPGCWL